MAQEILDVLNRVSALGQTEQNPKYQEGAEHLVREVGRLLYEDKLPVSISTPSTSGELTEGIPTELHPTHAIDTLSPTKRKKVVQKIVSFNNEEISHAREALGLNFLEASYRTGLSSTSLADLEKGKRSRARKDTLLRLAQGLNIDIVKLAPSVDPQEFSSILLDEKDRPSRQSPYVRIHREVIWSKRTEMDLSQTDLAQLIGLESSAVSRWEKGKIKRMRRENAAKLAEVLNIPVDELIAH